MTVQELIDALSDFDGDMEVRLAQQPRWPFEYSIGEVAASEVPEIVTRQQFDEMSEDEQDSVMGRADQDEVVLLEDGEEKPEAMVYIGEGSQLGYLPGNVSRALGWR